MRIPDGERFPKQRMSILVRPVEIYLKAAVLALLPIWGGCDDPDTESGATSVNGRTVTIDASPNEVPEWWIDNTDVVISGEPNSSSSEAPPLSIVTEGFWLSDGRILIVDTGCDCMHVYDATGDFIRTLGRRGRGPSEFTWIRSVTVTPHDSILAYDAGLRMVKVFHPDAGFIRAELIEPPRGARGSAEVWRTDELRYVYLTSSPADPQFNPAAAAAALGPGEVRELPEIATLHFLDGDSVVAEPVRFPGASSGLFSGGSVLLPFAPAPVVYVDDSAVYFGSGRTFEITELDSKFQIRRVIKWPEFSEPLRSQEIDSLRGAMTAAGVNRSAVDLMLPDELTPETRPTIGRILIDSDGRIWVARFEPRFGVGSERAWYVLTPSGEPLAKVHLSRDRRVRLLDIRDQAVLLLTWDPFDVPGIEVAALSKN